MYSGCDSKPESQAKPEPQAVETPAPKTEQKPPPAPAQPTSLLDADITQQAASLTGVRKFKLELASSGQPVHISVYHQQASAIPAAVLDLREKHYPKSTIVEYESEVTAADGRTFEVEVKTATGEKCEYSAKEDGTLIYTECQVAADTLPTPVQEVVKAQLPEGIIEEAEEIRRAGQPVHYEVEVQVGERKHKLKLDEQGGNLKHLLVVPGEVAIPLPSH